MATMKFELQINCDNADFDDDLEATIARLLRWVANRVEENSMLSAPLYDRNGNRIGSFGLVEE